jgi:hypothetical protein
VSFSATSLSDRRDSQSWEALRTSLRNRASLRIGLSIGFPQTMEQPTKVSSQEGAMIGPVHAAACRKAIPQNNSCRLSKSRRSARIRI